MAEGHARYDEWLRDEIQIWQTYHNHKERMAWTATTLFTAAFWAFLSAMPRIAVEHQWYTTFAALIAFGAILRFVNMQFGRRWVAADVTTGIRAALTKFYKGDNLNCEMSTADPKVEGFPNFVEQEITAAGNKKPRWKKGALKSPQWWKYLWKEPRWRSEIASYALLVLTVLCLIVALWLPPQEDKPRQAIQGRSAERAECFFWTHPDGGESSRWNTGIVPTSLCVFPYLRVLSVRLNFPRLNQASEVLEGAVIGRLPFLVEAAPREFP